MDKQDLQVDVEVYPESSRSSQEVAVPIPLTRRGKSRRKKVVRAKKRGQYKPRDKSAQSAPSEAGTVHAYEDSSNQDFEHSYAGPGEGPSSSSAHFETLDQQACSSQCVTSQNECDTYSHSMSTNMDLQDFAAGNEHVSKNDDKVDGNGCEANINKEHVSCPPATILSDTLASLTELVPDDWVVIADGKGFHFLKLSVSTFKAIQREIYIMYNGITSVAVHGVALSESSDFMKVVSDPVPFKEDHYSSFCERALTLCWEIEQYLVCAGADFEEAKNRWSEIPDTYIDLNPFQELTYTSSCRSNNCHRIIPLRFNSYRCTECQKIMKKIKERFKFSEKEDISEDIPNRNLTNKQVRDKLTEVTKKFRKSERRASYLQSKIKNLDVLLVNEGVDVVEEDSKFFANILEKSNLSEMQQIFLEQQFKYATASNPRAHRWHPALIRLAIRIRSQSSAAYETLRDSGAVMLPHSRTLFDYTHYIKEQVGINKDLLKMLAEDKDRQDKPENQYHALIFDEVYVSQNLVYKKSDGALLGYVYLDEVDKEIQRFDAFLDGKAEMSELPLASTVLAFMVKGLISNVKSVVASYPCKNLNKSIISARVWDVVSQCEGAGIKILALVCDGSPNNRAFLNCTPL